MFRGCQQAACEGLVSAEPLEPSNPERRAGDAGRAGAPLRDHPISGSEIRLRASWVL